MATKRTSTLYRSREDRPCLAPLPTTGSGPTSRAISRIRGVSVDLDQRPKRDSCLWWANAARTTFSDLKILQTSITCKTFTLAEIKMLPRIVIRLVQGLFEHVFQFRPENRWQLANWIQMRTDHHELTTASGTSLLYPEKTATNLHLVY